MRGQKTGGREPGTPNRLTKELRSVLKNIIADELDELQGTLKKLESKERIEVLIKLMAYVMPRALNIEQHTEMKTYTGFDFVIDDTNK